MPGDVTETVTVRRTTRDRHGDPVGEPDTHEIEGCVLAPRIGQGRATSEDTSEGETVIVGLTLYAPFGADLKATDEIVVTNPAWAGTYDVVGQPGRWQSPWTGWQPGIEVALTRIA